MMSARGLPSPPGMGWGRTASPHAPSAALVYGSWSSSLCGRRGSHLQSEKYDGDGVDLQQQNAKLLALLAESEARRQAAEERAAEERELRQAEREESLKRVAEVLKKLEERNARQSAEKWARIATRATFFPEAKVTLICVDESTVLGAIPPLPQRLSNSLSETFSELSWPLANAPERDVARNGSVHCAFLVLLLAIERSARPSCKLRRFYEESMDTQNTPDFTYTDRHEASVTMLSSLLSVELKPMQTAGKSATVLLAEGHVQCVSYMSSRVLALNERFPDAPRWEAVSVVSNMETLCVMRAVLTNESYVIYSTGDLPLRPSNDGCSSLPRGGELLARLLCAEPDQLGCMLCSPPAEIGVTPTGVSRARALPEESVAIGALLGSGGYCDVFLATWRGLPAVAKLPRSPLHAQTMRSLQVEARALRKLAGCCSPHLPVLLGFSLGPKRLHPALVMTPVGLDATRAPGSEHPPGSPERRALAEACAAGLFGALRAAHKAGLLHRDVRPTNLVWHASARCAVLIDWGIAQSSVTRLRALQPAALGWPDVAPDVALRASSRTGPPWLPCAASDCESGIYTLAALAFGTPCGEPPWACASEATAAAAAIAAASARSPEAEKWAVVRAVDTMRLAARTAWFEALPGAHPLRVARAAVHSAQVEVGDDVSRWMPYALEAGWSTLA